MTIISTKKTNAQKSQPRLKRITAALTATLMLTVLLTAAAGTIISFAGADDESVKKAQLEACIVPEAEYETAYGLRGFAASPDGSKLYLGYLHGPYGDESHVSVYDGATLKKTGEYWPVVDANIPVDKYNYYPKGLAVDNRGFLFVGVTHAETPYCSIYCVDNYLREIGHIVEDLGDVTGINGIATQKFGDRILLYVLTCYNKDTIRCYDVTDPTAMKLYDGFGDGGVVDYNKLTGSQKDPGYIAVDVDGSVYITCLMSGAGRKGSHVLKLSSDGKTIDAKVAINEAYGICTAGDYVFVSTYDGENSKVFTLNRSDLSQVASMSAPDLEDPLTSISFGGDYLYVADQGAEFSGYFGRVLRTSHALKLTRDPRETEKVDPGKYEVPPTAESTRAPTDAPDGPEAKIDQSGESGGGPNIGLIIGIIAGVLVLAAAAVLVVMKTRKK